MMFHSKGIVMNKNVIVWDLETVPDLPGYAAANDLLDKSDDEIRAILGTKFPNISTILSFALGRSLPAKRTIAGELMRLVPLTSAIEPRNS
jgi:hypothetical protein